MSADPIPEITIEKTPQAVGKAPRVSATIDRSTHPAEEFQSGGEWKLKLAGSPESSGGVYLSHASTLYSLIRPDSAPRDIRL